MVIKDMVAVYSVYYIVLNLGLEPAHHALFRSGRTFQDSPNFNTPIP